MKSSHLSGSTARHLHPYLASAVISSVLLHGMASRMTGGGILNSGRRVGRPKKLLQPKALLTQRVRRLIDLCHQGNVDEASKATGLPYATLLGLYHGRTANPKIRTLVAFDWSLSASLGLPLFAETVAQSAHCWRRAGLQGAQSTADQLPSWPASFRERRGREECSIRDAAVPPPNTRHDRLRGGMGEAPAEPRQVLDDGDTRVA